LLKKKMDDARFARERMRMVADQLKPRGIRDPRVLAVFESTPRHLFVPEDEKEWAYDDHPLPIGFEQTISQPYIVALMTESLGLTGSETVLEVGTGSGYQTAILSQLSAVVHTIEIIPELAEKARNTFDVLRLENIHTHTGDGSVGLPQFSPFDAIMVTAAAPRAPRVLLSQLKEAGRLIIPVGSRGYQELELWTRAGTEFESRPILPVAFVPLRGKQGWDSGWTE
jgi:protein-L-isoaspartate(D-aspartate) O-methyltransferase